MDFDSNKKKKTKRKFEWDMYGLGHEDDNPESPDPETMNDKMLKDTICSRKTVLGLFERDLRDKGQKLKDNLRTLLLEKHRRENNRRTQLLNMGYHIPLAIEAARNKPKLTSPTNPKSVTDLRLKEMLADAKMIFGASAPAMRDGGRSYRDFLKRFEQEKELRESNRRKKAKVLEAAINDMNNLFEKEIVIRLGGGGGALVETFPSGCLTLDFALGGGIPRGRIIEIYGPESSGKTTLALHMIAEVQKLGGNAMLVDAEHAFDPTYSKELGVDVDNLIVCKPDNGEMALKIADHMCRSGVDLICIDSVSALTPQAEVEGEIGVQQVGLQERFMSQVLHKMADNASKAGCTLIFLDQILHKSGVYLGSEVTNGGMTSKILASVRLEIRPTGNIKSVKGDEDIGVKVCVRVQNNKVSRPHKQAELDIIHGKGISKQGCLLDCAEAMGIVIKKESSYVYVDKRFLLHTLGQGRHESLQHLNDNPVLFAKIEKIVRKTMMAGTRQIRAFNTNSLPLQPEK